MGKTNPEINICVYYDQSYQTLRLGSDGGLLQNFWFECNLSGRSSGEVEFKVNDSIRLFDDIGCYLAGYSGHVDFKFSGGGGSRSFCFGIKSAMRSGNHVVIKLCDLFEPVLSQNLPLIISSESMGKIEFKVRPGVGEEINYAYSVTFDDAELKNDLLKGYPSLNKSMFDLFCQWSEETSSFFALEQTATGDSKFNCEAKFFSGFSNGKKVSLVDSVAEVSHIESIEHLYSSCEVRYLNLLMRAKKDEVTTVLASSKDEPKALSPTRKYVLLMESHNTTGQDDEAVLYNKDKIQKRADGFLKKNRTLSDMVNVSVESVKDCGLIMSVCLGGVVSNIPDGDKVGASGDYFISSFRVMSKLQKKMPGIFSKPGGISFVTNKELYAVGISLRKC